MTVKNLREENFGFILDHQTPLAFVVQISCSDYEQVYAPCALKPDLPLFFHFRHLNLKNILTFQERLHFSRWNDAVSDIELHMQRSLHSMKESNSSTQQGFHTVKKQPHGHLPKVLHNLLSFQVSSICMLCWVGQLSWSIEIW